MSINKQQLVDAVAAEAGITKADAERAIKGTMSAIKGELEQGGEVRLIGFGTFSTTERAARKGVNLQTGKPMKIPAKRVAKFKPGKALAEAVNNK